jgi:predicted nucleic acid-binding protein
MDGLPVVPVVIDANLALKAVLPNSGQKQCQAALVALMTQDNELVAPALWACETTSTLSKSVYFGQLTPDEGQDMLIQLTRLDVRLVMPDEEQNRRAFEWTLRLNRAAAYDSYYLALAESLACELWTTDRRLVRAAGVDWVRWAESST